MAPPKVLVIDDDRMTCQLIETFLEMENYGVATLNHIDDKDIISILQHEQPNILLLDYHLGSEETIDHVSSIRANEHWQHLPIIMTSAIDYSQACLKAGANDFIVKPFKWQEVVERISTILGNSIYQEV